MADPTRKALLVAPFLAAFAAAPAAASAAASAPGAASAAPAWIADFVDLFYRRKDVRTAFDRYVAPDYIQHSTGMGQGREAAVAVLAPMFGRPQFRAEPIRMLVDGDIAMVFLRISVGETVSALVIDIFRFAGQRIVEHWDVKQDVPVAEADAYFKELG